MAINIKRMLVFNAGGRYFESELNAINAGEASSNYRNVVDCDGALYLLGEAIIPAHEPIDSKELARKKALAKLTDEDIVALGLTK